MKLAQVVKQEVPILDYARSKGFTPKRVGNEKYTLAEHDSVRIDTRENLFFRHSTGQGGSIIDFAMMVDNVDKYKALSLLRDFLHEKKPYLVSQLDNEQKSREPPAAETPKKELILPEAVKGRFNRIYAYLSQTRGIDPKIISDFIHNNRLYEDVHHNCIFVGYDKDNNAAYAMKRGTLTEKAFKGDISGSRKEVGLYVDNGSTSLFVSEAVIDSMSIMTILDLNGRDYKKYNYLSLGGISGKALLYHLEGSSVNRIYLALDNDAAGREGKLHIRELLKDAGYAGRIIDKTPLNKDFNDDLRNIRCEAPGKELSAQKQLVNTKKQGIER